jgi:hypothetical protein
MTQQLTNEQLLHQIDVLKEQLQTEKEMTVLYMKHCQTLQEQFSKSMDLLDQSTDIINNLKTTNDNFLKK